MSQQMIERSWGREGIISPHHTSAMATIAKLGELIDRHLATAIGEALPLASATWADSLALTTEERNALALSLIQHLKLCGWEFSRSEPRKSQAALSLKLDELNASNDG